MRIDDPRTSVPGRRGRVLVWTLCLLAGLARAQEPPASQPVPEGEPPPTPVTSRPSGATETGITGISVESIQERMARVEAATDLSESVKAELLALGRQAIEQLNLAATWDLKIADYEKGREEAPQLLEAMRRELAELQARPASAPGADVPADATLDQLAQLLADAEAQLKTCQDQSTALDTVTKVRSERTSELPDLLMQANARLQRIMAEVGAPPAPGVNPAVVTARRVLLVAQRRAVEQEIKAYEEELRFFHARSELLATRRDKARLELAAAQARVTALQRIVRDRRQAEVERQMLEAEQELARAPQAVKDVAEINKRLVNERAELAARIDAGKDEVRTVAELGERLSREFAYMRANADRKELVDVIGPLVLERQDELNGLARYERALAEVKKEFTRVGLRIAELDDIRQSLTGQEEEVAGVQRAIEESLGAEVAQRMEPRVRKLLAARRETLEGLQRDYEAYSTDLIQRVTALTGLLARRDEFAQFISQRIFWLRSAAPLLSTRVPRDWQEPARKCGTLLRALGAEVRADPLPYALAGLAVGALLAVRPRLRALLGAMRERVARPYTDSFALTWRALWCTVLLSVPWPAALWFLASRIGAVSNEADPEAYGAAQALVAGLRAVTVTWLILELMRQICRPDGLGEVHFRWHTEALRVLRWNLSWLMLVSLPLVLIITAAERYPQRVWGDSVGRMAFVLGCVALSVFAARVLHPTKGAVANWLQKGAAGWLYRLRYVWYVAAVLVPLAYAATSISGYHYTALQFFARLNRTVWRLGLGLLVLHALLLRAVLVAQRKLAVEKARQRRAALQEAKETEAAGGEAPLIEEPELNLITIGTQTRKLLRAVIAFALVLGIWLTWADMLPALGFMKKVHLWSYTVESVAPSGEGAVAAVKRVEYITLAHLALALVIAGVAFVLTRNIPGLLEITILPRLPLDAGARFAVTTIARYVITIVGIVTVFNVIGVGWSNVQWLVAAVSVGLGFGLQEIFANFVSGLMLLFERPIRIGDTVTIGNITGTVTRIQIRATTITDWDRKELVIPNKEFITGQVVNWTLSDPMQRIVTTVGVAYGSDTDLVEKLLYQVAREEPNVLAEPEPRVYFRGFGESTLDFELRVFISHIDLLVRTKHQLHKAIDQAFRAAGIEIAFPQRDLHVRSLPPGLARPEPRPTADDPLTEPDKR